MKIEDQNEYDLLYNFYSSNSLSRVWVDQVI